MSQSASFVAENVTDVGQLFVDAHVIDSKFVHHAKLLVDLDHLHIGLHEVSGQELGDFEYDGQLKWDEAVQDQVETEESRD